MNDRITIADLNRIAENVKELTGATSVTIHKGSKTYGYAWMAGINYNGREDKGYFGGHDDEIRETSAAALYSSMQAVVKVISGMQYRTRK